MVLKSNKFKFKPIKFKRIFNPKTVFAVSTLHIDKEPKKVKIMPVIKGTRDFEELR